VRQTRPHGFAVFSETKQQLEEREGSGSGTEPFRIASVREQEIKSTTKDTKGTKEDTKTACI